LAPNEKRDFSESVKPSFDSAIYSSIIPVYGISHFTDQYGVEGPGFYSLTREELDLVTFLVETRRGGVKSNPTIGALDNVKSSPSNRLVRGHFFLSIIAHTDVLWYKTGSFRPLF
jgi:hypothetical protein